MSTPSPLRAVPAPALKPAPPMRHVPTPPPNRPHVTQALNWAMMDHCREMGASHHLGADGGSLRKTIGTIMVVIVALAILAAVVTAVST